MMDCYVGMETEINTFHPKLFLLSVLLQATEHELEEQALSEDF